jgi:predicted O-methyltransferase YrrM
MLSLDSVLGLYRKFANDLARVRQEQRGFYRQWNRPASTERSIPWRVGRKLSRSLGFPTDAFLSLRPQLDDCEAEILYLLAREQRPERVAEISPGAGWSSSWLLHAMKDNGHGTLYSFDLVPDSRYILPPLLTAGRHELIVGDVRHTLPHRPDMIDFLYMDSDHSEEFARWYSHAILDKLKPGVIVAVHDVFHSEDPLGHNREGGVILQWLAEKQKAYLTISPAREPSHFDRLVSLRPRRIL